MYVCTTYLQHVYNMSYSHVIIVRYVYVYECICTLLCRIDIIRICSFVSSIYFWSLLLVMYRLIVAQLVELLSNVLASNSTPDSSVLITDCFFTFLYLSCGVESKEPGNRINPAHATASYHKHNTT